MLHQRVGGPNSQAVGARDIAAKPDMATRGRATIAIVRRSSKRVSFSLLSPPASLLSPPTRQSLTSFHRGTGECETCARLIPGGTHPDEFCLDGNLADPYCVGIQYFLEAYEDPAVYPAARIHNPPANDIATKFAMISRGCANFLLLAIMDGFITDMVRRLLRLLGRFSFSRLHRDVDDGDLFATSIKCKMFRK
ncbi:hypothetical protein HPB50_023084 [Hyalomma asiaticum]|uniref:Uncharacterized protein n=1 Tax=Hyalomma asiaticum TaxID=266040 RepID=A0ACB7TPP4_HYAAI|nr:hypothetical protein HPB50_023084 [Hyalomma asiaticum]